MTTIKAGQLGIEHLGKYVAVPLSFGQSHQLREVRHLVYTSREATWGEPYPPIDKELGSKVVLIFSRLYPIELSPDDDVKILD